MLYVMCGVCDDACTCCYIQQMKVCIGLILSVTPTESPKHEEVLIGVWPCPKAGVWPSLKEEKKALNTSQGCLGKHTQLLRQVRAG